MMWLETLLLVEIIHNFFGMMIACCMSSKGFEFVNPVWIYDRYRVNVFGAIFLSIVFNLLCPIGTIIYWVYKLCTVGRR